MSQTQQKLKKPTAKPSSGGFTYDCDDCHKHFETIGEAVGHINSFKEHHLRRSDA